MDHSSLRNDLVQYMSCNKGKYGHLIDGSIDDHIHNQSFSDGRTESWATEAELTAAADWYNLEIMVSRNRKFDEWIRFAGEEVGGCMPSVKMHLLLEKSHFSLLCEQRQGDVLTLSSKSQTKPTRDWFDFTEEQPPRADILRHDNTSEHSVAHDDIGDSQKDGSTHISNKCLKETTSAAQLAITLRQGIV